MRSNAEGRIIALEILARRQADAIARLTDQVNQLRQQQRGAVQGTYGGGGGGGQVYWARSPGFAPATGAWPALVPSTGIADVYMDDGGSLSRIAADQTIRWWYLDAGAVGKLVAVSRALDGAWDALLDSCTAV